LGQWAGGQAIHEELQRPHIRYGQWRAVSIWAGQMWSCIRRESAALPNTSLTVENKFSITQN